MEKLLLNYIFSLTIPGLLQYSIKGDTQSQFMALLGAMMGKYPSRRPRTAKQAIDWLKVAKKTFVYE